MRMLVFGGRDFRDRSLLYRVLDELDARRMISCIIEGRRLELTRRPENGPKTAESQSSPTLQTGTTSRGLARW